ncbi:hypothetical protein HJC23_006380 [Cyclotella cryptica]|uniref:K Homology domain-containing protein n=1 Tax=Cyclotella cryptica TaxID=29204 RepID=A0ABD3Q5C5_9STRA|eukprot:CCRYP_008788-RA/>CCRYP_008788-RA protein AED:0.02 eAED:0.02 QI:295/1/1/1/1/1/4/2051/1347
MTTTNKAANKPIDPPAKDFEDDDADEDDDDDTVVGTCLHCNCPPPPRSARGSSGPFSGGCLPCPASDPCAAAASTVSSPANATRVQVSCDDCRSFICDGCHWCHEFQANHEIRVCDRCDAFYCRACDEMDQCEDCSEVVCNTCSTLMSCKFCGCGLCEDCATACGRCGIVLCARDAKFAVECDTCKMSYCLVCLASGTKDPCVRCGHRPSKRVEQLVHLRLKSIYKAFKQSGASTGGGPGPPISGDVGCNPSGEDASAAKSGGGRDTSSIYRGKYSSALRSLTENESMGLRNMEGSSNFDQSMANEVAAVLQTASNSMSSGGGDDQRRSRGRRVSSHPPPPFSTHDHGQHPRSRSQQHVPSRSSTSPHWRRTQEEIEAATAAAEASAEAAAAALLAELDEEEIAGSSKKGKKKKKKKDKKKEAAGETILEKSTPSVDVATPVEKSTPNDVDSKISAPSNKKKGPKSDHVSKTVPLEDESSDDEEIILEQLVGMNKSSSRPPKKEKKDEEKEKITEPLIEPSPPPPPSNEAAPELEKELSLLISNNDEDGLEEFLSNLKGVPGLAVLRKAAKKALKRVKDEKSPPEAKPQKQSSSSGNAKSSTSTQDAKPVAKKAHVSVPQNNSSQSSSPLNPSSTAGAQHEPLLRVVSRTQSAVGGVSSKGVVSSSTSVPATARAECVMHMSPSVVGWVIGKGGQRIRDMMEESGAKIWIDQESMGAKDARVVYVSGKRSAVDSAVRMVKDLIAKAPVAASAAVAQGTVQAAGVVSQATPASSKSASPVVTTDTAVSFPETASSFAAAAAHVSKPSAVAAATVPGPKSSVSKKAPAQGWSNVDSAAPLEHAPKPSAPVTKPPAPTTPSLDTDDPSKNGAPLTGAAEQPSNTVTSEIACDPQFVALLLGRDGLAAKSIQTESGAILHINQFKAPGKIGISGKAENVTKAEQLIHGVLNYREAQLQQESQKSSLRTTGTVAPMNRIRPDTALNQRADPYSNEFQMHSDNPTVPSMILPNLPRPRQEDIQFLHQQPPQLSSGNLIGEHIMNFPPGYAPYQKQSSLGSSNSILQGQSPLQQPPRPTSSPSMVDPNIIQQQEWTRLSQTHIPNQYTPISQFPSGHISGNSIYLGSNNIYAPVSNPAPQNTHSVPIAGFSTLGGQNLSFLQNLDAPRQGSILPPQGRLDRIENFLNPGNPRQDINEWGLNVNGATVGDTWNQSQIAHVARSPLNPGFATQHSLPLTSAPSLSNNLFLNHPPNNPGTVPQSSGKPKIDDSEFVDSMFDSLGEPGKDGDGLLKALNSVSLGGLQQGGTWGSTISGWGGLGINTDDSSSLLHSNMSGRIGFDSNNFGNQTHTRDER